MSNQTKQTTLHDQAAHIEAGLDRDHRQPPSTLKPSEVVQPTKVHTVPQQASTQPGDCGEIETDGYMHSSPTDEVERSRAQDQIPFKERVIGASQKIRGTVLGKPDLKQHGKDILQGRTTHEQDRKQ